MTSLNPEAVPLAPQDQVKSDSVSAQQNSEDNVAQTKAESLDRGSKIQNDQSNPEDPNWKAFREARKRDRADKEVAERKAADKEAEVAALKAAMDAAFSAKSSPSPQAYQQYYGMNQPYDHTEEDEEQKIERKVNALLAKREEQYRKQAADEENREYPKRLMRDLPDFGQVCSQENLDYLDYHYPEVSRPLQRLGEGYDKWHDTYYAVKKLIPNHANAKKEAARADININKPRSMSSSGASPTGEPVREGFQDTEARRAANWQRMNRTMKGM